MNENRTFLLLSLIRILWSAAQSYINSRSACLTNNTIIIIDLRAVCVVWFRMGVCVCVDLWTQSYGEPYLELIELIVEFPLRWSLSSADNKLPSKCASNVAVSSKNVLKSKKKLLQFIKVYVQQVTILKWVFKLNRMRLWNVVVCFSFCICLFVWFHKIGFSTGHAVFVCACVFLWACERRIDSFKSAKKNICIWLCVYNTHIGTYLSCLVRLV